MTRRGLALMLVTGVLGILALLVVTLAVLTRLERRAALARVHQTRAFLLARSGLEDASARFGAGQDPEQGGARYAGEDWNANGVLDGLEVGAQSYLPTGGGTLPDRDECPARHALRASFFVRDPLSVSGDPLLVPVEGKVRGLSGRLSGEGATGYVLRARTGGFDVNGGDPTLPYDEGYNAVLANLLAVLADAIDAEDGTMDASPVGSADGKNLVVFRPARGWASLAEIRDLALGGSQRRLDALEPYLLLAPWRDLKVARPNGDEALAGQYFLSWGDYKLGHKAGLPGTRAPDFERGAGNRVVGRAPVYLGWARHRRPALEALFRGLQAVFLDQSAAANPGFPGPSADCVGRGALAELTPARTGVAAGALLAHPAGISAWADWDAFCDTVPFTATTQLRQALRDLLKANAHPDACLNKFNPGPAAWKLVDKSDQTAYSTEFVLSPLSLVATCTGRIVGPDGRLLASRTLRAERSRGMLRITTQREFACADLGRPELAGDEGPVRLPGSGTFLSEGTGSVPGWGHALNLTGQDASSWMDGDSGGATLQLHPEPYADAGAGLAMNPADYDGSLQLSTLETPASATYGASGGPAQMTLLGRFTRSMDLDLAGGDAAVVPDFRLVQTGELGLSLLDAAKPGTLYPDGAYSEWTRAPAWRSLGNLNGFHGVASVWMKTNFPHAAAYGKGHPMLRMTNYFARVYDNYSQDQLFLAGILGDGKAVLQLETGRQGFDVNLEHGFRSSPRPDYPGIWQLLTLSWDLRADDGTDTGEVRMNGGAGAQDSGTAPAYPAFPYLDNDASLASDLTLPDGYGAHRFFLGGRHDDPGTPGQEFLLEYAVNMQMGSGSDATFDELAFYDFGGALPPGQPDPSPETLAAPGTLALNRWKDGRFYRGAAYGDLHDPPLPERAGGWFSAPVSLPAGSRLERVAWTWRRPSSLPTDFAEMELTTPDYSEYLWKHSRSSRGANWTADRQDWAVRRTVPGPFRIHAVFRRMVPPDPDTPLLESPVLEDIGLVYSEAAGSASWEELP